MIGQNPCCKRQENLTGSKLSTLTYVGIVLRVRRNVYNLPINQINTF